MRAFWPARGGSLLLVVDVQEGLLKAFPPRAANRHLYNLELLLRGARLLGVPRLYTEHYPEGLGPTAPALRRHLADAARFTKTVFSAYRVPAVAAALAAAERPHVVLAGTETHVCVLQTALDLLAAGYTVHVPADGVLSRFREDWEGGLGLLRQAGAAVTRTETVLFQWLEGATDPAFRKLLTGIRNRNRTDINAF